MPTVNLPEIDELVASYAAFARAALAVGREMAKALRPLARVREQIERQHCKDKRRRWRRRRSKAYVRRIFEGD